jgi:hypothetical protein
MAAVYKYVCVCECTYVRKYVRMYVYARNMHLYTHTHLMRADECSVDYDPDRKMCNYFAFAEPPAVPYAQFVTVGYCNNTEGSFEVLIYTCAFLCVYARTHGE